LLAARRAALDTIERTELPSDLRQALRRQFGNRFGAIFEN